MAGKKYYTIWKGLQTGIFDNWKECEARIRGVDGARYRSFQSKEEAERAYLGRWEDYIGKGSKKVSKPISGNPIWDSWSVDAACSGNPGIMEYRGVETKTGKQLFHQGPFPLGTNNIGEFLGIVHALALLKKRNSGMTVYTDSRTAIKWLKDKKIKTKLPRDARTETLFELLDRALFWLENNEYSNPVLKWETEQWGEIPADFGRK